MNTTSFRSVSLSEVRNHPSVRFIQSGGSKGVWHVALKPGIEFVFGQTELFSDSLRDLMRQIETAVPSVA